MKSFFHSREKTLTPFMVSKS